MASNLDLYSVYKALETCDRSKDEPLEEYIEEFKTRYADAEGKGIRFSSMVKAFKMLEASGCTKNEKSMILADIKYDRRNPAKMCTDMEEALKRVAGEGSKVFASISEQGEAKQRGNPHFESEIYDKNQIHDGQSLKCYFCDSKYHLKSKCEDYRKRRAEKRKKAESQNKVKKGSKDETERED